MFRHTRYVSKRAARYLFQSVEVVIRNIESIRIGSYPTNTTILEGMPFDASDLTVIADCGNGETFEAAGYTLSGYDTSVPGEQAVTVTYGGKTAQFNITVTPKSLTGIELTHTPDKLIYYQGDTLDITGMVITAVYNNNTSQFVDNDNLDVSELSDSVGEQTVTVTYGVPSAFTTLLAVCGLFSQSPNHRLNCCVYVTFSNLGLTSNPCSRILCI